MKLEEQEAHKMREGRWGGAEEEDQEGQEKLKCTINKAFKLR